LKLSDKGVKELILRLLRARKINSLNRFVAVYPNQGNGKASAAQVLYA
jgi:hypothetical protein